ncbi:MAG: S16 family serine protease [Candidatus Heimdallarchaeota archaeon]
MEKIHTEGEVIGLVNGFAQYAVLSDPTGGARGGIIPIKVQVMPARGVGGRMIAIGSLRVIARESVQNISVLIKKYTDKDISKMDVHIHFVGAHVIDDDSVSVAIATGMVSAFANLPVRQNLVMAGALSVQGEVMSIDGVVAMTKGASAAGIKHVIIPASNFEEVELDTENLAKVNIIPVKQLDEVLVIALVGWNKRTERHREAQNR